MLSRRQVLFSTILYTSCLEHSTQSLPNFPVSLSAPHIPLMFWRPQRSSPGINSPRPPRLLLFFSLLSSLHRGVPRYCIFSYTQLLSYSLAVSHSHTSTVINACFLKPPSACSCILVASLYCFSLLLFPFHASSFAMSRILSPDSRKIEQLLFRSLIPGYWCIPAQMNEHEREVAREQQLEDEYQASLNPNAWKEAREDAKIEQLLMDALFPPAPAASTSAPPSSRSSSPSSSFSPLSDRAVARACRPRPWVQSQTRPTSLASKPRTTPVASTAAPVDGLAARRQLSAAQSSTVARLAAPRQAAAAQSTIRSRAARLASLYAKIDRVAPPRQAPVANSSTREAHPMPSAVDRLVARHVRLALARQSAKTGIPAPVESSLASKRQPICPCGILTCNFRQRMERTAARIPARRERIAALKPPKFSKRLDKLEALAADLARQCELPPSPTALRPTC